jgi:Rieske Fe-S protein
MEPVLSRRDFIKRSVQLAVAGALVPASVAQALPILAPDALSATGPGPLLRRDPRTRAKRAITLADLAGEPPVVVTAEWNFLPAVVYKVSKASLQGSSARRGYNTAQHAVQHPAERDHLLVAYDGKCKHLGCTVGFDPRLGASKDVVDYDGDGLRDGRVLCPCHQGQYDIHDLGLNVPGTPPPAPLNVIEFDVLDFRGDPDRGVPAARQAVYALGKLVQGKPRAAAGQGSFPRLDAEGAAFSLTGFAARAPGWSLAPPPA